MNTDNYLEVQSTLTDRFQTTVPSHVRSILKLKKGDRISYSYDLLGRVIISRAVNNDECDDDVMLSFLRFIDNDIKTSPQHVIPVPPGFMESALALVSGVDVDIDINGFAFEQESNEQKQTAKF